MDGQLVIPFTLRNAILKTLHETHPGQFGMKYLAQYVWRPHINRQVYFHGINCSECTMADKGNLYYRRKRRMIGTRTIDLKMATRTVWLRKRINHRQRRVTTQTMPQLRKPTVIEYLFKVPSKVKSFGKQTEPSTETLSKRNLTKEFLIRLLRQ